MAAGEMHATSDAVSDRRGNLTGREADVADRHYILAERNKPSIFWEEYERVSGRPGWQCHAMPTKHDVMVEAPDALADLLRAISNR